MNEKQFYTSPEVDVLVVRFEANIMSPMSSPSLPDKVIILDALDDDENWW